MVTFSFRKACAALFLFSASTLSANAEVLTINAGDVACVGFDPATVSCIATQRGQTLPDGRVALAEESYFDFAGDRFVVASGYLAEQKDEMLCIDGASVKARPTPLQSDAGRKIAVDIAVDLRIRALDGLCVSYSDAGEDTVATFFAGGEKVASMTTQFRLFRSGDPLIDQLQPRPIGPAGIAAINAKNQLHSSRTGFATIHRDTNGHYYADARTESGAVRFLVDTGASKTVLTQSDAISLGIDVSALNYSGTANTAGGSTSFAPVVLAEVNVGGVKVRDVDAAVTVRADLSESLLGMSFLGRLGSFQFRGDQLELNE